MQKKLLIAVTNRSSYNKIKPIVRNLPSNVTPLFLLGGGVLLYRFGGIEHLIEKDFPDVDIHRVHLAVEGDDLGKMGKTVGLGIIEVSTLLDIVRPDAVLVCADRFETLAISVSASYKNIRLIHLQGGEDTGTIDDKVRNANTMLSDIHFPATYKAGDKLVKMLGWTNFDEGGKDRIFVFGCPSMDTLMTDQHVRVIRTQEREQGRVIDTDGNWEEIYNRSNVAINSKGTGAHIDTKNPFVIVMLHGDTTDPHFIRNMHNLTDALEMIPQQKVIFWNNIDPKGDQIAKMWRGYSNSSLGDKRFVRHIEPEDFACLLLASDCIIGNSSTGIREASFLGVPSVNIGDRQHGREHGCNVTTVPFDKHEIYGAITRVAGKAYTPSNLYGDGNAGWNIANRIAKCI